MIRILNFSYHDISRMSFDSDELEVSGDNESSQESQAISSATNQKRKEKECE